MRPQENQYDNNQPVDPQLDQQDALNPPYPQAQNTSQQVQTGPYQTYQNPIQPYPEQNVSYANANIGDTPLTARSPASDYNPGQPAVLPDYLAPPPEPIKKKSKRKWILFSIAIFLVVLLGVAAAYYFLIFQKPEKVVFDAITKAINQDSISISSQIDVKDEYALSMPLSRSNLNLEVDKTSSGLTINVESGGAEEDNAISLVLTTNFSDDFDYFKTKNILATSDYTGESFVKDYLSEQEAEKVNEEASKIDDTWVKVSRGNDAKSDDIFPTSCLTSLLTAFDSSDEMANSYKQNQFFDIDGSPQKKDGLAGYAVSVDGEKYKSFMESLAAGINDETCFGEGGLFSDLAVDTGDAIKATVWVTPFGHDLKKIDLHGNDGSDMKIAIDIKSGEGELVEPNEADAIELDEWTATLKNIYGLMMQGIFTGSEDDTSANESETEVFSGDESTDRLVNKLRKAVNRYYALNAEYPKSLADLKDNDETSLGQDEESIAENVMPEKNGKKVSYTRCNGGISMIVYIDGDDLSSVQLSNGYAIAYIYEPATSVCEGDSNHNST